jgi:radical SAM protein with 4Fe4S-binding SPASM domain
MFDCKFEGFRMKDQWKINYLDASKYACMEVYMKENLLKKTPPASGLLFIGWEVTRKCQLRCKMCYSDSDFPQKNELTKEEVLGCFDQARDLGANLISLTGGEPFLRKDLAEILIKTINMGYDGVFIPSNGIITSESLHKFEEIRDSITLGISLDGSSAKLNNSIRIPGSYKEAIQSIKTAKRLGIPTIILMTITKTNFHDVPNMLNLAAELDVDQLALRRAIPSGRGLKNYTMICPTPEQSYEAWRSTLDAQVDIKFYDPIANVCNRVENIQFGGCTAGTSGFVILSDGDVVPCPELRIIIGNIRNESIADIWYNSDILKKLRNRDNLVGQCGECIKKWICGGCRGSAYNLNNNYLSHDTLCWNPDYFKKISSVLS